MKKRIGIVIFVALCLVGCKNGSSEAVEGSISAAEIVESVVETSEIEDIVAAPELRNGGEGEERVEMRAMLDGLVQTLGLTMTEVDVGEIVPNYELNINDVSLDGFMVYEGESGLVVLLKSNKMERTLEMLDVAFGGRNGVIGNTVDYAYYVEGEGIETELLKQIGD